MYGSGLYTGISYYSNLNWSRSKLIDPNNLTLYKNTILEFRFTKSIASLDEDNYENLTELGLLYGKSFGKVLQFKVSGGIGILTGSKQAGYNPKGTPIYGKESVLTPGIPLEIGIRLAPSKYFGVGVTGFANLNSKASLYGGILTIELGKLYSGNRTPSTRPASFVQEHKTSVGIRGAFPLSYGLTIKRFTDRNNAIEGILSSRNSFEYNIYGITVLFEKEYKTALNNGINWFWGGGLHAGYGPKTVNNGYRTIKKRYISIGPDGVLGIEYSFDKIPFTLSLEVNPGIDLILYPWITGAMSVRYVL